MKASVRVGLRCDAGLDVGVGHLIRCIALAEELTSRDATVCFVSDVGDVAWARRQLEATGAEVIAPPRDADGLARLAARLELDAVVLDGYHLDRRTGEALRARDVVVLAVVDGAFGHQDADLWVDQNFGAEQMSAETPGQHLAGARYAMLRDIVRRRRPAAPPEGDAHDPVRVLAFFGGTDAAGAAEIVVPLVLSTGRPLAATVVAARDDVAKRLTRLPRGDDQQVHVVAPVEDLPALVTATDVVVSAAGTSTWELLCLGAPTVVVAVADNQEEAYRRIVDERLVAGIGVLHDLRDGDGHAAALATLDLLLADQARRGELARRAWEQVDGRGRERVVDALLDRVAARAR